MRLRTQSVNRQRHLESVSTALATSTVFIDTNILVSGFQLNDAARYEFLQWLQTLSHSNRLVIPAWAVHEFNNLLAKNIPGITAPHRAKVKPLEGILDELQKTSLKALSTSDARSAGFENKDHLLAELRNAAATIQRVVKQLTKTDAAHRTDLLDAYEELITNCGLTSDTHALVRSSSEAAAGRFVSRLSPGHQDENKSENPFGDLILWNEVLNHCASNAIPDAMILTNDVKSDWVYSPKSVEISPDKWIDGTSVAVSNIRLTNPDLIAEFKSKTNSENLQVISFEAALEVLASSELNQYDSQKFSQLALSLSSQSSPTDAVLRWFSNNPERYEKAVNEVCNWQFSPGEVDMERFITWASKEIGCSQEDVDWGTVFVSLFL
jgi:hypothetical protein